MRVEFAMVVHSFMSGVLLTKTFGLVIFLANVIYKAVMPQAVMQFLKSFSMLVC